MSHCDPLHHVQDLDLSTPGSPSKLACLIDGQGYRDLVGSLQYDESARLIEYFDTALDTIDTADPAYRICLQELRRMCGIWKTVPRSCMFTDTPPITAKWAIVSRGSCDVYSGFIGDSRYSVKRLRIYSDDKLEMAKSAFCKEAVVWRHLDHPNIVPLLGVTISPCQFITAWMVGGELSEYINTHPFVCRLGLLLDVANALNYLHSRGIIHGDLKGPSVLVNNKGRAHLTDFGLSTVFMDSETGKSIKDGHTVRWSAPEILNKQVPVSTRSDVFSFGMVVVEAFTGKPPFHKISSTAAAVCVLSGERPRRPARQDLTNDLWEITERCWHRNSQCRPDVTEVVHCLRNTIDLRNGHIDVDDDRATDNTGSESVPQEGSLIRLRPRPPRWTPVSYVLRQLYKIGRFSPASRVASDADDAQHVEDEKPIVRRHQASGTPELPQRARCFFSGYSAFRRSHSDHKRSKTKSTVIQGSAVPSLNRSHSHVMGFKVFRARSS